MDASTLDSTRIDFDRYDRVRPLRWTGSTLEVLDQRRLPFENEVIACRDAGAVADAIHALAVRGAPAIGIAAAWGVVLAARGIEASDGMQASEALDPALQPGQYRALDVAELAALAAALAPDRLG